jgi:hypothetical protein
LTDDQCAIASLMIPTDFVQAEQRADLLREMLRMGWQWKVLCNDLPPKSTLQVGIFMSLAVRTGDGC